LQPTCIELVGLGILIQFIIKSVTPGQAAVFYDGDVMLGGGIIDRVFYKGKEKMITSFHDLK